MDNDFFDIAGQIKGHGTPQLAKKVLESVYTLYKRTTGVSLEGYYRDIETRGAIGRFCKTSNQPMDWAARKRKLEELIRRIYIQTTGGQENTKIRKPSVIHKNILSMLETGDTIITFNYDLLIEESIESALLWNPITGYDIDMSQSPKDWCRTWLRDRDCTSPPESSILLLKLHGSLNWIGYPNGRIGLKARPYVVRTNRSGHPAFETVEIVAPGWQKRIDEKPYGKLWQRARLKLEKCKSIVIFGYSMPETDFLAKSFFAEIARTREARKYFLEELHLADPNQLVRERFIKLFTGALGPYGKVYQYESINAYHQRYISSGSMPGLTGRDDKKHTTIKYTSSSSSSPRAMGSLKRSSTAATRPQH